jgi:hypothetical protein
VTRSESAGERALALIATVLGVSIAIAGCTAAPTQGGAPTSPPAAQSPAGDPATAPSLQEQLEYQWSKVVARFPEAVRPDVQLVRYIDQNEWASIQAECMNAEGFPDVFATRDGGLSSGEIPSGQEEAYQVAEYVCFAKYPLDPKYLTPWTDERLGRVYDYYANELIPCLEKEGYDPPEPPSRVTFIDGYDGWSPYLGVVDFTQDEWFRINELCPQWPADLYD